MKTRSLPFPLLLSLMELATLFVFFSLFVNALIIRKLKAVIRERNNTLARLTSEKESLSQQLAGALLDLHHLKGSLEESTLEIAALKKKVKDLTSQLEAEAQRLHEAKTEFSELHMKIKGRPQVAKVVLGLKGRTDKVAILFDCSGSMAQGGRWGQAQDIVKTWTAYLDIGECALISFSTTADLFKVGPQFWFDLRGKDGEKNKALLVERLASLKPSGGTNTLAALELAYGLEGVQTIFLFSDGAPNDGNSDKFDQAIADRIYELCAKHKKTTTVNTVGLGNYFEEQFATFLMLVAERSGGSFQGR